MRNPNPAPPREENLVDQVKITHFNGVPADPMHIPQVPQLVIVHVTANPASNAVAVVGYHSGVKYMASPLQPNPAAMVTFQLPMMPANVLVTVRAFMLEGGQPTDTADVKTNPA